MTEENRGKREEEVSQKRQTGGKESKKKGCFSGCLIIFAVFSVILLGVFVYGYFNRYKILPRAMNIAGVEIDTIASFMGEEIDSGLPAEFTDRAYRIEIPEAQGRLKISSSDTPVDEKYNKFVDYFSEEGWVFLEEFESVSDAPGQLGHFSKYLQDMKAARMQRGDERISVFVSRYNDETIGAVWRESLSQVDAEKQQEVKREPEEVEGEDPDNFPLFPEGVRISFMSGSDGDEFFYDVAYAVKAARDEVVEYYENEMEKGNWSISQKARVEDREFIEAHADRAQAHITIEPSSVYEGYSEIHIGLTEEAD